MRLTHEDRDQLLAAVADARGRTQPITPIVNGLAELKNVTPRRVWQVLKEGELERLARGYTIDDHGLDFLYRYRGRIPDAHEALREAGHVAVGLRWFQHAVGRDVWAEERAFMQHGAIARRAASGALRWEASDRNAVWATDHVQLGVNTRIKHGGRITRMYLTYFLDCWSRRVMGWALDEYQTAEVVLAALHRAIREPNSLDAGGVPATVMFDNGPSFLSEALGIASAVLGYDGIPVQPYHPNQNGKVERCHQTLQGRILGELPGWSGGPRDISGRLYERDAVVGQDLLRSQVERAIHEYNFERPHSAIGGMVPHAKWLTGRAQPRRVAPELLRFAVAKRKEQIVHPSGVTKHSGGWFWAPELQEYTGKRAIVAWLDDDPGFVDVYTLEGGHIVCAPPNRGHSAADRRAHKADQRARFNAQQDRLDRAQAEARERFGVEEKTGLDHLRDKQEAVKEANDELQALLLGKSKVNGVRRRS